MEGVCKEKKREVVFINIYSLCEREKRVRGGLLCLWDPYSFSLTKSFLWRWVYSLSRRALGGLLCLFSFSLTNSFFKEGFIGMKGVCKEKNCEVVIINIYSSREREKRGRQWEELVVHRRSSEKKNWLFDR